MIKRIDIFLVEHKGWRGEIKSQISTTSHETAPGVIEDWTNGGSPCWSHEGIPGHGKIFKAMVKLTLHRMPRESSRLNSPRYFVFRSDHFCRSLLLS